MSVTGTSFRKIRTGLGLDIVSLASHLGVHRRTIWAWESSRSAVPKMADIIMSQSKRAGRLLGKS